MCGKQDKNEGLEALEALEARRSLFFYSSGPHEN